ncbi:MAG: putative ABC transporter permease subunit [Limisphaerales bacterium]
MGIRIDQPGEGEGVFGLLLRLHLVQAWRRLRDIRQQSKLLSALILLFVSSYVVLAFWLFGIGLRFVGAFPGLGYLLVERLMFLLFAFLFILLVFSNLVISYSNLFRNRETAFLLTLPITPQTVFRWKLVESMLLASWAFLFLVSPLLVAYGLHTGVAWHFYAATPVLLGLFIVLPAVVGSWLAIYLARFLDRRSFQVIGVVLLASLVVLAGWWLQTQPLSEDLFESRILVVLDKLLTKTRFAESALLPSYWLSSSVLQWAEGAVRGAGFFALLLLSYAMFFGWLAAYCTGPWFYGSVSAVQSRGSVFWQWKWFESRQKRKEGRALSPRLLDRLVGMIPGLDGGMRGIMVKDVRVFWRDTTQWGQTLVLFGLLGVYVLNLRHFSHQLTNPFWVHLVSYLNLGACALNLATLTTRFVFPQFSLEGKRIWIVGLAPMGLVRVVVAKLVLGCVFSLMLTVGLIVLSCVMLQLSGWRTVVFAFQVAVMTFAMNGLAMGLGTMYPNLKEDQPSKIVSGFGGTLCLVLSFLYIVIGVLLLALGSPWSWLPEGEVSWTRTGLGWGGFWVLSIVVGYLPMRLGLRRVRQSEL